MADFPPPGAPIWEKWERLADEWPKTDGPEFPDGGQDIFAPDVPNPIRRWRITYRGKTLAQIQPVDDWRAATKWGTFQFTDRDGQVYGGVRCVRFERGHNRTYAYSQFRELEFEDRP